MQVSNLPIISPSRDREAGAQAVILEERLICIKMSLNSIKLRPLIRLSVNHHKYKFLFKEFLTDYDILN